jgi:NTE family protein
MLVLPRDLKLFGFDEKSFSIAKAVRMSMSIPVYYEPYVLSDINGRKHFIVDGGLLSNYPIWLMDDQNAPCRIPVFGFKLSANGSTGLASRPQEISNIFDYTKSIVSTALDTHDKYYISNSNGDKRRTIFVPAEITLGGKTKTIKSTDFSLSRDESETLFQNGVEAARRFLKTYDYEEWERAYRK